MALEPTEKAKLRQFLEKHFNLSELRNLAFDLGIDFQLFYHETVLDFSRELVAYLERREGLSCLIMEIVRHRPNNDLVQLLAKLPPCLPYKKIQIILPIGLLEKASEVLEELAAKLEVPKENIVLVGMASGSMHLLIGSPERLANLQVLSKIHLGDNVETSIVPFDTLDQVRQKAWRLIACEHPPTRQGDMLRPTFSWQASLRAIREVQLVSPLPPQTRQAARPQILIIEDDEDWSERIADRLQKLGYQVQSVLSYRQACRKLEEQPFDLAVVNIALQREMPPHWKADWSRLLSDIQQQGIDLVVVTSIDETLKTKPEIEKLKTQLDIHHEARIYDAGVFFKSSFVFREFETYVNMKLERRQRHQTSPIINNGGKLMDWNTIVNAVVSAVSPYAPVLATGAATAAGTSLGKATIEKMWQWIEQVVSSKGNNSDKQILERFKQDSQNNKDSLNRVILQLSPNEDAILSGLAQGLVQEVQRQKGAQLFSLLDNANNYTINDLRHICSRINPDWESEVPNPTREAMSRWVVNYTRARTKGTDLIAVMLDRNPAILLQ